MEFAFFTPAEPDRVWQALTDAALTREYMYGLALKSDWTVNAAIVATLDDSPALVGEVLCTRDHRRLSYLISAPDAPAVYLTWLIRNCGSGSVCSLQVDEAHESTRTELEDTWLPVIDSLQRLLVTR